MKKNYLAPKSETLMAVLREVCDMPNIGGDPSLYGGSASPVTQAPRVNGAPATGHSL